jgi:hypothetical protein
MCRHEQFRLLAVRVDPLRGENNADAGKLELLEDLE